MGGCPNDYCYVCYLGNSLWGAGKRCSRDYAHCPTTLICTLQRLIAHLDNTICHLGQRHKERDRRREKKEEEKDRRGEMESRRDR